MFELAEALVGPIARLLLKSAVGDTAADVASNLYELAKKHFSSRAAEAQQQARAIAASAVSNLEGFFRGERVDPAELNAAAYELGTTIGHHLSPAFLLGADLDEAAIGRALIEARPPEQVFSTAEPALGLYRRLVTALAVRLRPLAPEMRDYRLERDALILRRLADLQTLAEEAPRRLAGIEAKLAAGIEDAERRAGTYDRLYRQALRAEVQKLRLFGLDVDARTPTDLPLSIAYIPLKLKLSGQRESELALDFPDLLAILPLLGNRLLIAGPAGSGKSTLLQWTALTALEAQDGKPMRLPAIESVCDKIRRWMQEIQFRGEPTDPGFERLRSVVEAGTLPRASDSIEEPGPAHPAIRDVLPWWQRTPFFLRLRSCVDGKLPSPEALPASLGDELGVAPEPWVRDRLTEGDALVLLDGIDEVPLGARDAVRASIERYAELYPRCQFVVTTRPAAILSAGWTDFFQPWRVTLQPMAPIDIERFIEHWHRALALTRSAPLDRAAVDDLRNQVLAAPARVKLAETPLLCAAICYLHRSQRGELPRRAVRLYETLTEQLVHRLDEERLKREGLERLAPALAGLDLDDKIELLAGLAHFMMTEGKSELGVARARQCIAQGLLAIQKRQGRNPALVLEALQERSGVLRGASTSVVEFAHNSLKAYLAARIFADKGSVLNLVNSALASDEPDLPPLAASMGDAPYRTALVDDLLQRASSASEHRRLLQIMALRVGAARTINKESVAKLRQLAKEVLPPRDLDEAGRIADLGTAVVPLLRATRAEDSPTAAACVRALRLIGRTEVTAALEAYLTYEDEGVVDELAQAVDPFRIAAIVAQIDAAELLPPYGPMRHLREHDLLSLDVTKTVLNLAGSGLTSLAPITRFTSLAWLSFDRTGVSDLEPLRGLTGLQHLYFHRTDVSDLEPLRGLTGLQHLDLGATSVSDLEPLRDLTVLQHLDLGSTAGVNDLEPLRALTSLRYLDVAGTHVSDLRPLRDLTELAFLDIYGTTLEDLEPLRELTSLRILSVPQTIGAANAIVALFRRRGQEVVRLVR